MSRPFVPAPNTASAELIYTYLGQTVENVLHVQKASPFSFADLQALRAVLNTWDSTQWYHARSVNCLLTRIRTKALDSNTAPTEDWSVPTPRPGALNATDLPGNVTICVKLSTGLTGRSARGRIYVPGPNSSWITGQSITSGVAAALIGYIAALITSLSGASPAMTLVVTSYRNAKAWRITAVNYAVVGAVLTDYNTDSQRRRLTGRGRP